MISNTVKRENRTPLNYMIIVSVPLWNNIVDSHDAHIRSRPVGRGARTSKLPPMTRESTTLLAAASGDKSALKDPGIDRLLEEQQQLPFGISRADWSVCFTTLYHKSLRSTSNLMQNPTNTHSFRWCFLAYWRISLNSQHLRHQRISLDSYFSLALMCVFWTWGWSRNHLENHLFPISPTLGSLRRRRSLAAPIGRDFVARKPPTSRLSLSVLYIFY